MRSAEILHTLAEIAEELTGTPIAGHAPLKENGVDSLLLVSLVVATEGACGITFSDDDLQPENLRTLADLAALAEKYL